LLQQLTKVAAKQQQAVLTEAVSATKQGLKEYYLKKQSTCGDNSGNKSNNQPCAATTTAAIKTAAVTGKSGNHKRR